MDKQETNGSNFIPASQRPDGTWRKPRRVKEGYVPQEEVPLYESKGKQFLSRKSQMLTNSPSNVTPHQTIPGLFITDDKKEVKKEVKKEKKKPKPAVEGISKTLSEVKITSTLEQQDPAKRLKNLRKRLREIEVLEQKIESKEIKNPDKEQLEKVGRKVEVMTEIIFLQTTISN